MHEWKWKTEFCFSSYFYIIFFLTVPLYGNVVVKLWNGFQFQIYSKFYGKYIQFHGALVNETLVWHDRIFG